MGLGISFCALALPGKSVPQACWEEHMMFGKRLREAIANIAIIDHCADKCKSGSSWCACIADAKRSGPSVAPLLSATSR